MSNITAGDGGSFSSGTNGGEEVQQQPVNNLHGLSSSVPSSTSNNSNGSISQQQPPPAKKKRNLPGNPGELINSQPYVFMNLYFSDFFLLSIFIFLMICFSGF